MGDRGGNTRPIPGVGAPATLVKWIQKTAAES